MIKQISIIIVTVISCMMFSACSVTQKKGIQKENITTISDVTASEDVAMKPVIPQIIEDNEENGEKDTNGLEEERIYNSVSEYMEDCDPNWNDSEKYKAAIHAYESTIISEKIKEFIERNGGIGETKISYAYIDEDDIPELLIGVWDSHPCGIIVFTYIPDRDEAVFLGEFGIYGHISYNEKKNRIITSHGNQGYYMVNITTIKDGRAELVGSVTMDGDGILIEPDSTELEPYYETLYYAGYTLPKGVDGSNKDSYSDINGYDPEGLKVEDPGEQYIVDEEEYNRYYNEYLDYEDGDIIKYIPYSEMARVMIGE